MVIIAAVDQTEQARLVVQKARELADAFGDELHVVHVMSQSEFTELEQDEVQKTGQPGGKERAEELAANVSANTAELVTDEFTAIGFVGQAHKQLTRYAREQKARYIVIGGRKRSPIGKAVFGSTTQSVLLNSDTSVVVAVDSEDE